MFDNLVTRGSLHEPPRSMPFSRVVKLRGLEITMGSCAAISQGFSI
jgi:hypothetical protein